MTESDWPASHTLVPAPLLFFHFGTIKRNIYSKHLYKTFMHTLGRTSLDPLGRVLRSLEQSRDPLPLGKVFCSIASNSSFSAHKKRRHKTNNSSIKSQNQPTNQPTMKITYIVVGTLLLLASLALASDPEDLKDRQLRTKNTPGLGRGGKRTLEAKQTRDTNTNTPKPGRGGKRTLETKQRPAKSSLAVNPRPPELQMEAATNGTQPGTKHLNPNSCVGHCGGNAGNCYCDNSCQEFGDCCNDVCEECSYLPLCPSPHSCQGRCGEQAPGGCYCDDDCHEFGDCCNDVCNQCSYLPNCLQPFSCHGNCDGQSSGGCWCDSVCSIPPYDCCADVCNECYIDC